MPSPYSKIYVDEFVKGMIAHEDISVLWEFQSRLRSFNTQVLNVAQFMQALKNNLSEAAFRRINTTTMYEDTTLMKTLHDVNLMYVSLKIKYG